MRFRRNRKVDSAEPSSAATAQTVVATAKWEYHKP
jgi:hypothetical protein